MVPQSFERESDALWPVDYETSTVTVIKNFGQVNVTGTRGLIHTHKTSAIEN